MRGISLHPVQAGELGEGDAVRGGHSAYRSDHLLDSSLEGLGVAI
jgi:hypothetical protein